MLYTDVRINLPISSTYRQKRSGVVYLYKYTDTYYTQDKKQRHKSALIGRVEIDKESGIEYLIPNDTYFKLSGAAAPLDSTVRSRGRAPEKSDPHRHSTGDTVGVGFTVVCLSLWHYLGIKDIADKVFGTKLAEKLFALACYYAAGDGKDGLDEIDLFLEKNLSFLQEPFNGRRACELFTRCTPTLNDEFLEAWIKLNQDKEKEDSFYYDVTSVSSYSDALPEIEFGYNRDKESLPQLNIGLLSSRKNDVPLFYTSYNGSINDTANFNYVLKRVKDLGLSSDFALIFDGGFSQDNINFTALQGHNLLLGVSQKRLKIVAAAVDKWRKEFKRTYDNSFMLNEEIIYHGHTDFTLGTTKGRLLFYYSLTKEQQQLHDLYLHIAKEEKELEALTGGCPEPDKYKDFFTVTPKRGPKGFSFKRNEDAVHAAELQQGVTVLFTSLKNITDEEALLAYRNKDRIEKMFETLKNDIIDGRMHVHSLEAWQGKLFVLFLALILRKELHKRLKPVLSTTHHTFHRSVTVLKDIKMIRNQDRWVCRKALTAEQKSLLNAALPFDMKELRSV